MITSAQDIKLNIHVKLYLIKIFGPILNLYYNTDRTEQGYTLYNAMQTLNMKTKSVQATMC